MSPNAAAGSSRLGGQPKPPVVVPGGGNNIVVNPCQRGNPVLECIRNVGKEFGDILADYQVGRTTGVLFLSLRYHRLHPEYIHQRIERLGHAYNLRILLLMCDVSEHQDPIRELTKICLINEITVMVAWNAEEAGYYLSTYKQFEHKPPDLIKERVDKDYHSMLRTALTSISKVNKTDVETLRTSFGSFAAVSRASSEQLQNLPGFGQVKAKRIQDAFNKPFRNNSTSAIPISTQLQLRATQQATETQADKDEGREVNITDVEGTSLPEADEPRAPIPPRLPPAPHPRAPRARSPAWDIELDLNSSPEPESGPPPVRKRPPSPMWDIELDLNVSDTDDGDADSRERKRLREGSGEFGAPSMLTTS
ncbi:DNA repair protein rad10 [Lentinus tigrinus ALCF2SS1-7]|uniref:DNA excision repair protein ERCC-1 n=1 Tax=Lentinus tigrinus ALCF2SS1-6 TaxID=1328759 RepID=A0A5C2SQN5_9APHY|nr:DNA repair protein rad10 [Lentinus tigrinus ALCF2SS1-6]RPD79164.1 DNA repair protein rad10 [Lentinus tigrinus ALCF2SS1-7]